jgi:CheY-like chemotaxis protein
MSRRRILVVDDDDTIRELLELALRDEGYEVGSAGDGGAALEMIERFRPHLILLDLRMAGMDGATFAAAYRKRPGRRAPIAVVSAVREPALAAAEIGAQGFLAKPFDLGDLLSLVARLARG